MKALPHQAAHNRYARIKGRLNEKSRWLWAGAEALELGYGGIRAVARATGLSPVTIQKGMEELFLPQAETTTRGRQRAPGGGRKPLTFKDPAPAAALDKLMEPCTSGDPMRPLRWTCKSTGQLASELTRQGHPVSAGTVGRLLKAEGYSLQGNRKRFEGKQHPDRDAQFRHIADSVEAFQARDCPVISVDTKKKEPVGNFLNRGQEWNPKGEPVEVEVYDFIDADLGKAIPCGVYDPSHNLGWVSVGTDHDTAQFAVKSIRRWWEEIGEWLYPRGVPAGPGSGGHGGQAKAAMPRLGPALRAAGAGCLGCTPAHP